MAESTFTRFLAKLRELLRARVKDADLSEDDFDQAVRTARSHIGGVVHGENLRAQRDAAQQAELEAQAAATEDAPQPEPTPAQEANVMNTWHLLSEIELAEGGDTATVQIFPAVGTYEHPKYGTLAITSEFLKRVKANFDAKVYQQELPLTIDLEHQSNLSGAAGWISNVEIKGDSGMWATVSFNERGKQLVSEDAYRYFSPEFYDSWQDPASQKKVEDLLIGGALTNRPFFKGMAPVVMGSEGAVYLTEQIQPVATAAVPMKTEDGESYPAEAFLYVPDSQMPSTWKLRIWESPAAKVTMAQLGRAAAAFSPGGFRGNPVQIPAADRPGVLAKLRGLYAKLGMKPEEMPAHIRQSMTEAGVSESDASAVLVLLGLAEHPIQEGDTMGMTPEEAQAFTELSTSVKSLREQVDAEKAARAQAETVAKTATEQVAALRRDATRKEFGEIVRANRLGFQGEVDAAVDSLERFQKALAPEDFAAYLEARKAQHKAMAESAGFQQTSTVGFPSTGAESDILTKAKALVATGITMDQAIAKVASEEPKLYAKYIDEQNRRVRRGGE